MYFKKDINEPVNKYLLSECLYVPSTFPEQDPQSLNSLHSRKQNINQ